MSFMLFGPSDTGGNPVLNGLILGAILGLVVLVGRLLFRKRQQVTESKEQNKQEESEPKHRR